MCKNLGDNLVVNPPKKSSQKKNEEPPSPTFGGNGEKKAKSVAEGMEKVGKHGKSHHEYIQVMKRHDQANEYRPITLDELSSHNTKDSAWTSLNGIVYDVTVYLNYHPGGDILLQGCGKDCTNLFNSYHPWVNGKYLLDKYKIGFLRG